MAIEMINSGDAKVGFTVILKKDRFDLLVRMTGKDEPAMEDWSRVIDKLIGRGYTKI